MSKINAIRNGLTRSESVVRRRYLLAITFLIVSIGNQNLVAGTLSSPPHPILGNWTIVSKDGACAETYRFRPDGMLLVTSGQEVAEVHYDISPSPSGKGFYKWNHRVLRNNNKPDCSGKLMNPGDVFTWFIQIDTSNEAMYICQAESRNACFGPLRREVNGVSF